jgi:AcrR family transcriptional regulator
MNTEPTRPYHSPRRLQGSLETRRGILDAALMALGARGYAQVTVAEIAAMAGVAVRTVYASVGSKPQIIAEVFARAAEQSGGVEVIGAVRRSGDALEVLRLLARGTRGGNERNQAIFDLARSTAGLPEAPDLRGRLTRLYIELLRDAAAHLDALGALPADMSTEEAGEVLWFCFGIEAWTTMTRDLGHGWDTSEEWLLRRASQLLSLAQ